MLYYRRNIEIIIFYTKKVPLGGLTRKVSQVSLTDFNDPLICCRASKN